MSEIGAGSGSSYPTTIDTDSNLEVDSPNVGKTLVRAATPNDLASAVIAIETALGTTPQGTKTDVKTFLQVDHNTDGTEKVSKRYMLDTGAADAYVITPVPAIAAYAAGQMFSFTAVSGNTTASTLAVSGLTAKAIKKSHNQALIAGDIEAGQVVTVIYDGTNFQMQSQSGAAPYKNQANTFVGDQTITGNLSVSGTMTSGIVSLGRMAYITTVTFTSIANNAYGDATVTHGLGTDNVMVMLMPDFTHSNVAFIARRVDGYVSFFQMGAPTAYLGPTAPATGDVAIRFRNESGGTLTTPVRVYVLRED